MANNYYHTPVLLKEAVLQLNVVSGKKYIDATLGGGGHTHAILQSGGIVLGMDKDNDALTFVSQKLNSYRKNKRLTLVKGSFGEINRIASENGFGRVMGILFDIGLSSYQLDASGRGFSIKRDEKLDMRMDETGKLTAYDVVNFYPKDKLIEIFYKYGEEHNAVKIAEEIAANRKKNEIETTRELASIVEKIPHKSEAIHPATRIFQAIRIEVNGELEALKKGLSEGLDLMDTGGRMVVISFHSLEDRIVKQTFDGFRKNGLGILVTKKPITASSNEMLINKRARSAKMRVFEKK